MEKEDLDKLWDILNKLKSSTETHIDFERLRDRWHTEYALIIALENYLEVRA